MTARDTLLHLARSNWRFSLALENGVEVVVWPTQRGQDRLTARSLVREQRTEIIALLKAMEAQDDRLLTHLGYPTTGGPEWTAAEAKWREVVTPAVRLRIEAAWASYDVSALKGIVDGIVNPLPSVGDLPDLPPVVPDFALRTEQERRIYALLRERGTSGATTGELDKIATRFGARTHGLNGRWQKAGVRVRIVSKAIGANNWRYWLVWDDQEAAA